MVLVKVCGMICSDFPLMVTVVSFAYSMGSSLREKEHNHAVMGGHRRPKQASRMTLLDDESAAAVYLKANV